MELIINSDERSAQQFESLEAALEEAERWKAKSHIVDIEIYDYTKPIDQECVYSAYRSGGVWIEED